MRSTRAAAAVTRLGSRFPDRQFVMATTPRGEFSLSEWVGDDKVLVIPPTEMEAFIKAVNAIGAAAPKPLSKNDQALQKQISELKKKNSTN
jgi:uncharacterized protein (DUF1684 family)